MNPEASHCRRVRSSLSSSSLIRSPSANRFAAASSLLFPPHPPPPPSSSICSPAVRCLQVIAGTEAPAVELKPASTAAPSSPAQEVANPTAAPKATGGVSPPAKRKVHIVLPEPSPRPQAAGGRGGGPPGSHVTGHGKAPPRSGTVCLSVCLFVAFVIYAS